MSTLAKVDDDARRIFANVTRHNGFEAWRRLAEPINDDKVLLRKELLPRVTSPRRASKVDDVEKALREWGTTKRLFTEAGGSLPADDLEHVVLVDMTPSGLNVYITMHLDPQYTLQSATAYFYT